MKAEELMIGDWVTITEHDDFHGYIAKVVIINGETDYITVHIPNMHLHDVFADDLQPVQLTKEILEKNGWKKQRWWRFKQSDVITYDIVDDIVDEFYLEVTDDGFALVNDLSDDEDHGYMSNWVVDINYVHELQHALKLCKIEKEIII